MAVYLAGIDVGTTGSKSMIFDESGTMLANAYREYPCTYPKPGWVEQDADLLVREGMASLKEAVANCGIDPRTIASVSVSAQRSCGIFLDRDEKILRPMISWQDNRTPVEAREVAAEISEPEYYRRTGYPNSTTWLLPKILWVRKNEPEVWKKTARIVQMHDYFLRALGVEDYFVDHNDAGFFGCFNNVEGAWDDEILRLFNIPREILPIPRKSGTAAGRISRVASGLSGLPEGIPVSIGAGDQSAGSVGAGIVRSGLVSISMGTAGAVTAFLDQPFRDPAAKTLVTAHPIHRKWLLEGYQAAAASVYRWYKDEIAQWEQAEAHKCGEDFYSRMNTKISEIDPGSNGLLVLPYFATAGTPRYNPHARGVVLGLTFAHNRYHLARSFMEGITLDMKDMLNSMISSGIQIKEARILGGPTKSAVWNQIQADVYDIPVTTLGVTDATVLGAAILGGVGAGVFPSISEGADAMVRLVTTCTPNPESVGTYEKLYSAFCRAYDGLEENEVFSSLAELQQ